MWIRVLLNFISIWTIIIIIIKQRTSRKSIEKYKGAEKYFSSIFVTRQCTSTNKLTISITK